MCYSNCSPDAAPTTREILEWIFPGPIDVKHQSVSQKRVKGSGEWFINSSEFQSWVSGKSSGLLYSPGKGHNPPFPYCLTISWCWENSDDVFLSRLSLLQSRSAVVDELLTRTADEIVGVAYYYFDLATRDAGGGTSLQVMGSVCKQMIKTTGVIPQEVYTLYQTLQQSREPLNISDLKRILISISGQSSSNFIILDALDNCLDARRMSELDKLLDILKELSMSIKICATARPESMKIKHFFAAAPTIKIVADEKDIRRYLDTAVETIDSVDPEEKRQIVDKLVISAKGL